MPEHGIPAASFYAQRYDERHKRFSLRNDDQLFRELDNGDASDVDQHSSATECYDVDDDQSSSDSSDDDCQTSTAAAWCRKRFAPVPADFRPEGDENSICPDDLPSPYAYFTRYIPQSIFLELAEKTNQYSVYNEGISVDTNESEVRKLVALHLAMGVLRYPRLRLYWTPSMRTQIFSTVEMSRNRFEKLRNMLHVVDVNDKHDTSDRLWKVRPLLTAFRSRCQELVLEENLCIDEQIVPFKGQLDIKQYVKGKPNPWGVKIFFLCGSSGLTYDFIVYQGSTTELRPEYKKDFGVTGALVLQLAERIPADVGHKLFYDNYFTSLPVLRKLLEKEYLQLGQFGTIGWKSVH